MVKTKIGKNGSKIEELKELLVPYLFTENQLEILQKKMKGGKLTKNEQVYYYGAIAKKVRGMHAFLGVPDEQVFMHGEEHILPERKKEAYSLLKKAARKHRSMKVLITGSFLYKKEYNDIDIFCITKQDKEDHRKGKLHYNYLSEDVFGSLFFASLAGCCVSNFPITKKMEEVIGIDNVLLKYQEIMKDMEGNATWLKRDLQPFLLMLAYLRDNTILDSFQLHQLLEKVMMVKSKKKLVRKLFVAGMLTGFSFKELKKSLFLMVKGSEELKKSYKQEKFYDELIASYQEVLESAS